MISGGLVYYSDDQPGIRRQRFAFAAVLIRGQNFGKAAVLCVAGLRITVHDEGENPVFTAQLPKIPHFLAHPGRLRRGRGTDHHQRLGCLQCLLDRGAEIRRGRQVLAVAKYRRKAPWNRAERAFSSYQAAWDPVTLKGFLQPCRPCLVAVAVAQKCLVPDSFHAVRIA